MALIQLMEVAWRVGEEVNVAVQVTVHFSN
jgi:hypothetical protein